MEIFIIRCAILGISSALLFGVWKASGWLIEAGYLPGTNDPHYFGYGISQAMGAMLIMMLMAFAMSIINWLVIGLPREKAKRAFWGQRGKSWPR